jgi:hypothetical protein
MRRFAWLAIALTGCLDTQLPKLDLEGPRLVGTMPSAGSDLGLNPTVELTFEEPLYADSVHPRTVLFMTRYKLDGAGEPERDELGQPEDNLSDSMATDLNAGIGLDSDSYLARTVYSSVQVSEDGTRIVVVPQERLLPLTEYIVVLSEQLRDLEGNRLGASIAEGAPLPTHLIVPFSTEKGPPVLLSTNLPGEGGMPAGAPPLNRASITLTFDRAMNPPPAGSVLLTTDEGRVEVVLTASGSGAQFVATLPGVSGAHAALCPQASTGDRLCPNQAYELVLTGAITDSEGGGLERTTRGFRSGLAADAEAPVIGAEIDVVTGETDVTVGWTTDEISTTELVFDGDLGTVVGTPCSGDPCAHELRVEGLALGQTYTLRVVSQDLALNRAESAPIEVTTVELPDVAITEVHPNPSQASEATAEFVELFNYGTEPIDLAGWTLRRTSTSSVLTVPEGIEVAPGAYVVLTDDAFDAANFPSINPAVVVRGDLFTLVNSGLSLTLSDEQARQVSSTPNLNASVNGESLTRNRLDAADFCLDSTPSPGVWLPNTCL